MTLTRADWAPKLNPIHVATCQVFRCREDLVANFTTDGDVGAEIGVQHGHFSSFLLRRNPRRLWLVDVNLGQIMHDAHPEIEDAARGGVVHYANGTSHFAMTEVIPVNSLDWIYIDADHDYEAVCNDLRDAVPLLKGPESLIFCNDYTVWDPIGGKAFGVMKAVNEFCLREGWKMIGLGLQGAGFHDVALRKL